MELLIPQPTHVEAATTDPFAVRDVCVTGDEEAAAPAAYLAASLTATSSTPVAVGADCAIVLSATGEDPLSEAYQLDITTQRVTASAGGGPGLFAAAHTLRQLALLDADGDRLATGSIRDEPRYPYRGFMLDVTRRFYPVEDVQRVIDDIALYKINTLHLHLSDDQGWRLAIDAYPALTQVGAQTQTGWPVGSGGPWFYTKDDYASIVAYAASRGVVVVPEFEGPGHTNAAQTAVPELNCDDRPVQPYIGTDVGFSLYCLSDARHVATVERFLTDVWIEVAALTPGPYLHIGGDEAHSASDADYGRYVTLATEAVRAQGKQVMGWQQIAGGPLPPGSVVQFWAAHPDDDAVRAVVDALDAGAQVVMSPASRTYLDHKYDDSTIMGMQWAGFLTVQSTYAWDPAEFVPGLAPREAVLGVEATLFADRTFDASSLEATSTDQFVDPLTYADAMVFPRLPAVAEVAWVGRGSAGTWPAFANRLARHDRVWSELGIGYTRTSELWAN